MQMRVVKMLALLSATADAGRFLLKKNTCMHFKVEGPQSTDKQ